MSARRVVITGIGAVTGYGRGVDRLWQGLASGRSAVRDHKARLGRHAWARYRMADLPDEAASLAGQLPKPKFVEQSGLAEDPDLVAIADCIQQSLLDAGLAYDPATNDVGLIVTHESPGLAPHVQSFFRWGRMARAWLGSRARFNPAEFLYEQQSNSVYRLHSFLYIHYLSALFDLHGFTLYNNNACSSGAFALAVAADRILSGESSAVVVAAGDLPEDGTKYRWFRDLGLYSARGDCRPFASDRDGMVLGSGAAALVLEDLETARARGRHVYGEWLGGGFTSDGWKVTMPDVVHGRYKEAIRRALRSAAVRPHEVSLITPHGLGTNLFDQFESMSLSGLFDGAGARWPPLMLLKGAVGHTLGGCVLVETVASLLACAKGMVPLAARGANLDPEFPFGGDRAGGEVIPPRWVLLKCTNGFAGQNGAIVLRSVDN